MSKCGSKRPASLLDEDGDDVEHTRDELQRVGAADDLVVARVGPHLVGVGFGARVGVRVLEQQMI